MRATNLPVTSGRWADGQSTELAPSPPSAHQLDREY